MIGAFAGRFGLAVALLAAAARTASALDDGSCIYQQGTLRNRQQVQVGGAGERPGSMRVVQCVNGRVIIKVCLSNTVWQCEVMSSGQHVPGH